jgi:2-polyprenyl-6-methoxyphenol hydroxylase-like FAD-dependent oxidoreductase
MNFDYDVVIIGGAFSGAATALMLKRQLPDARVLIIEKTAEFDRKVGPIFEMAGRDVVKTKVEKAQRSHGSPLMLDIE